MTVSVDELWAELAGEDWDDADDDDAPEPIGDEGRVRGIL
jgi:hypothetical protein